MNNLASAQPDRVKEMIALYDAWAKRCHVIPPEQLPHERRIIPANESATAVEKSAQPAATPPGGAVALTCEVDAAHVMIEVLDTGVGISAEKLQRVFEPFVQLDQSLTRSREGVGLGLAISRDLARGMGGDLTVRSAQGEGSAFTLVLPNRRGP